MPLVWSDKQVKAGQIKTVKEAFKGRHLPWCESVDTECSCFGKKREEMLTVFANAVAENNESAKEMYMKVIYGI